MKSLLQFVKQKSMRLSPSNMSRRKKRQVQIELEQKLYRSCTSKNKYKTELKAWSAGKYAEYYNHLNFNKEPKRIPLDLSMG